MLEPWIHRVGRKRLKVSDLEMNSRRLVGKLSFRPEEGSLRDAVSQSGEVKSVLLMLDRETGRSRGFAFIDMNTHEEAQAAIRAIPTSRGIDSATPKIWRSLLWSGYAC